MRKANREVGEMGGKEERRHQPIVVDAKQARDLGPPILHVRRTLKRTCDFQPEFKFKTLFDVCLHFTMNYIYVMPLNPAGSKIFFEAAPDPDPPQCGGD